MDSVKRIAALLALVASGLVFWPAAVEAHQPHDVSPIVAFDPDPTAEQVVWLGALSALAPRRIVLQKSTDGGFSWTRIVRGFDHVVDLSSICLSSNFDNDETIYAAAEFEGAYRSTDGGESFEPINNGLPGLLISEMLCTIDSQSRQVLLAAAGGGGLRRSANGGDSWNVVFPATELFTGLGLSPNFAVDGTVLAGTAEGELFESTDGGVQWNSTASFPSSGGITEIVITADGTRFIGTTDGGVFRSLDGGASYGTINSCLPDDAVVAMAASPDYATDQTLFVATYFQGVFKSTDGGDCFDLHQDSIMLEGNDQTDINFRSINVSPGFSQNGTVFVGMFAGLWKSTDGGVTWLQLDTIPADSVQGFGISPNFTTDNTLGLARYGGGISMSDDGAQSWDANNLGNTDPFTYHVEFSPNFANDGTVYSSHSDALVFSVDGGQTWRESQVGAFPTFVELSPNFTTDGTIFFGSRDDGLFRSTDRGRTWTAVLTNPLERTGGVAMSPNFENDGLVWAGIRLNGVFRSLDGGDTWAPTGALPVDARGPMLEISPNFENDGQLLAATLVGLYESTDGGTDWDLVPITDNPTAGIDWVGFSPNYANDGIIMASVRGAGLFRSTDGGQNWDETGEQLILDNELLIQFEFAEDFAVSQVMLGISHLSLFRSDDGGATWSELDAGPVRFQTEASQAIRFSGPGWRLLHPPGTSGDSIHFTPTVGDQLDFYFVGTSITWIGATDPSLGIAEVFIDGVKVADVDQFGPVRTPLQTVWSLDGLSDGPHDLVIRAGTTKNPNATGFGLAVDALQVE